MSHSAYLTPSILLKSASNFTKEIDLGTASRITKTDSLMILTVVRITIKENNNVHRGSAILPLGCEGKWSCQISGRIILSRITHIKFNNKSGGKYANTLNEITYDVDESRTNIQISIAR